MSERHEGLVPGSLAARVLDYLRSSKGGNYCAGDLTVELEADESEIRAALATLRKAGQLTALVMDGIPYYRVVEAKPQTIPGSALKPPPTKAPVVTPIPARPTETPMPKRSPARRSAQDEIMAFFRKHPGAHSAQDIHEAIGGKKPSLAKALTMLKDAGTLVRKPPRLWCLAVSPPAPKAAGSKAPRRANLARFGAVPAQPPEGGLVFAIDAHGNVAIESLRLAPTDILNLVDFLTRTQNVWKPRVAA